MASRLKLSGVVPESIVDGPGIRYTLFVQGCPHHCPGCHNPQTHAFDGGYWSDFAPLLQAIDSNPLLSGVTFSGGEPFCQAEALGDLAVHIRKRGKTIVVYSGYTFEQLLEQGRTDPYILRLLSLCDLLVDGPYLEEQRDLTLPFRGSRNQRLIDLQESCVIHRIQKVRESSECPSKT